MLTVSAFDLHSIHAWPEAKIRKALLHSLSESECVAMVTSKIKSELVTMKVFVLSYAHYKKYV